MAFRFEQRVRGVEVAHQIAVASNYLYCHLNRAAQRRLASPNEVWWVYGIEYLNDAGLMLLHLSNDYGSVRGETPPTATTMQVVFHESEAVWFA
jgi:hypothetical protein